MASATYKAFIIQNSLETALAGSARQRYHSKENQQLYDDTRAKFEIEYAELIKEIKSDNCKDL